jgi:transcription antitermination factor NusG
MAAAWSEKNSLHWRFMKWYCVYTHPLKEAIASGFITETLGVECFYPKLKQRVIIRRVKRDIVRPLFPRYIFCRFDLATSYRSVSYASDVVHVVSLGRQPIEVSDEIIAALKSRASASPKQDEIQAESMMSPGSRIEIVSGVMRGFEGLFLRPMNDSERVAILLSTLNASVVVERSQCRLVETPSLGMTASFA